MDKAIKDQFSIDKKDYEHTVKTLQSIATAGGSIRPKQDYDLLSNQTLTQGRGYFNSVESWDLYELSRFGDVFVTIFKALRRKIFKRAFLVDAIVENPSEAQKVKADKLILKANENGQTLKEVLGQFENDLNWNDDAFLLLLKDYFINANGEIIGSDVKEIMRLFPLNVKRVMDSRKRMGYDEEGRKVYFSIGARQETTHDPVDKLTGIPNLSADYKVLTVDGDTYYNRDEIINKQKFNPSIDGGFSPMYSLYNKGFTLVAMDWYVRLLYATEKPSKKMVFLKSSNLDSLKSSISSYKEDIKSNPHGFHPIAVQTKDPNSQVAEVVDFMNSLEEMQFTQVREEYRNAIGAEYGVSPVFQNDVSTAGGLNNEGLQITVTNEAVEGDQEIYNDGVLPIIFNVNMGITDYQILLPPNEEEDESFSKDLMTKDLNNAKLFLDMGGKVTFDDEGELIFRPGELVKSEAQVSSFTPFAGDSFKKDVSKPVVESKVLDVKKVDKVKGIGEAQFQTNLDKELNSIIKKLDLKKAPSEKQLLGIVGELTKNFDKKLKAKSSNRIKEIYKNVVSQVNKELGTKAKIEEVDKNAINALKRDPKFTEAFVGLSASMTENLKKTINKAYDDPEGFSVDKLVGNMKEELETANNDLRRIARTESTKIAINARKNVYEKTGDFDTMKFEWIGPNDNRTGSDTKEIVKRVGKGVTWDNLVNIITDVSKQNNKDWVVDYNAPIPRPNTRRVPIRVN